jgi:CheY-like chemotaxis protein
MPSQRPRIAIVEDDEAIAEWLADLLTEEGYDVLVGEKTPATLTLLRAAPPDLVLLDLRLAQPGYGWIILRALRADPATATLPIIALTADMLSYAAEKAAEAKELSTALLEKPVETHAILTTVARLLGSGTLSAILVPLLAGW